ncbi:MAG: hypothetical protein KGR25_07105, partial [Chloroflexi bacterium]|nr:hypothetical protein [Chloroflexota bacterium]
MGSLVRRSDVPSEQSGPRNHWASALVAAALFMGSALAQWFVGRPFALTWLSAQDDEGYMLALLKLSAEGDALYSQMYSQYGPVFHWVWNTTFSALQLEYSLTDGRLVTLACWVLASLGFGVGTYRLTGSVLAGLGSQWAVFMILRALVAEPMHPNGILAILLALAVVVLTFSANSRLRWIAVGIVLASTVLVKVNAGLLLTLGLGFSLALRMPQLRRRPRLAVVVSAAFMAPALLLVRTNVWLLLVAFMSMCILGVALWRTEPLSESEARRGLLWFPAALLAGILGATGLARAQGTPPKVLWDSLVVRPLGLEDAFALPYVVPSTAALAAITSLLLLHSLKPYARQSNAGAQLAVGGLGSALLVVIGPAVAMPLSWLVLVRQRGSQIRGWELPALATWFLLTIFPVAGSQVAIGSILFIPILLQVFVNGFRSATFLHVLGLKPLFSRAIAGTLIAGAGLAVIWSGIESIRLSGSEFSSRPPFNVQNPTGLHLSVDEAKILNDNSQWIKENCDTFYSLPGLNTYYILTSLPIPGSATATTWWALLTSEEQQRVIADMERAESPC